MKDKKESLVPEEMGLQQSSVARGSSGRVNLSFDLFQRGVSFCVKPLCIFKFGEVLCETDINRLKYEHKHLSFMHQ